MFDAKVMANEILQARGYLVICGDERRCVGQVLERVGQGVERLEEKTVVIAETDRDDALAQLEMSAKIGGGVPRRLTDCQFYYRVIAE